VYGYNDNGGGGDNDDDNHNIFTLLNLQSTRHGKDIKMVHTPKALCECVDVTVLWNQAVHTDREFMANRPGIIIKKKKEKTCILIDVTIPVDGNVMQK